MVNMNKCLIMRNKLIPQLKFWIFLIWYMATSSVFVLSGQRFIQIEQTRDAENFRIAEGEIMEFKTRAFPNDWQKGKVEKILMEDQVIIFADQMIAVADITQVRIYRPLPDIAGKFFLLFGTSWLIYGIIALIFGLPNVVPQDLLIGLISLLLGLLIGRFSKRKFRIGKQSRIRLIDITFP